MDCTNAMPGQTWNDVTSSTAYGSCAASTHSLSKVRYSFDRRNQTRNILVSTLVPPGPSLKFVRQDLNSSILVGSKRIVDHTSFTELEWKRESVRHLLQLPPGLQIRSHLFSDELIEVLEDIYALERIRDDYRPADCVVSGVSINDHIASIQSRLEALPKPTPIMRCCYLGAYLCSVMLCCTIWCALVIPVSL